MNSNSCGRITRQAASSLLVGLMLMAGASGQQPLRVDLYSSMRAGINDKHAIAFTRPLVELIGRNIQYPLEVGLQDGETADDLLEFGHRINQGASHLGVMWAIEYAWLREPFPQLSTLVMASQGGLPGRSMMMVRQNSPVRDLADLRGSVLAHYAREFWIHRLIVQHFLDAQEATTGSFFRGTVACSTITDAILAVTKGDADCVMVDAQTWTHHISSHPEIKLRTVYTWPPWGRAVLVGNHSQVDRLRPGLWDDLRQELISVHRSAEGEQCTHFWRFERFEIPPENHDRSVQQMLIDFPSPFR